MARFWAKFGDDKVLTSIVWGVFFKEGKEQEEAMLEAMEHLQFLEDELKGKRFFGGERIGFVDLALGWLANMISIFEEVAGLKMVDEDKFPLLAAWMQEFADSPIIKDNWPPRDKMIAKFQALPLCTNNCCSSNEYPNTKECCLNRFNLLQMSPLV
ncbi:unnamed protein product, partial [Vitis vinifera]